ISYLTIEKKGNYTNDEAKLLYGWIFGCDICQNVCPYNKNATYHNEPFFEPIKELNVLNDKINELSKSQFNKLFASSSIKRCGLNNLIRNLTVS
ncbi:MAG TPA: 4Fe-4S double cluster binding domain-containing protein, partial [Bacteroidales bacterium]|nr:4Fe-4S double cluster binding domain-containing protein [Bacteroidales bacterium]